MSATTRFLRLPCLFALALLLAGGESIYARTNRIAFTALSRKFGSDIHVINGDGTGQIRLTNNPESDFDPSWSPNGQFIAYVSEHNNVLDIYRMRSDGTGSQRLTQTRSEEWFPAWSPDGRQIVFVSNRDQGSHEIYVMNADGSNQTRLTRNNAIDVSPNWSPDGKQIVFVSKRDGDHEIYVMNADGSEQKKLSQNTVSDYTPAWSPDGKHIAFISDRVNRRGVGNVYLSNLMGDRIQLTHSFLEHNSPVWSSDGQKIAYTVSNEAGGNEIRVMNLDGSEGKTVLISDTFSYSNLAWQPPFSSQK